MTQGPSGNGGPFAFLPHHRRILITGGNGAGKTRLATALTGATGLPLLHKDAAALRTGWQQRPQGEVEARVMAHVSRPAWLLDAGPSVLTPQVLVRADLVIWLDPPALLRLWRILRRSVRYVGRTRPEHPPGNRDWPGPRQIRFLAKAWTTRHATTQAIEQALAAWPGPVWRIRSTADSLALSAVVQAAGQRTERL